MVEIEVREGESDVIVETVLVAKNDGSTVNTCKSSIPTPTRQHHHHQLQQQQQQQK